MKTKIYIAGKITGETIANCFKKFGEAKTELERRGFEVITPFDVVGCWQVEYSTSAARFNRKIALKGIQAIYMLPCSNDCVEAHADLADAIKYHPELIIYYELENVEANELADSLHG